ncbi:MULTISPECIES: hypothetical protein [unclassified Streptomyces]|uniref:hypothetical protein n=1 Tax=unclassified Streptomyces TaxID=2593676 RepID=UPI00093DB947|nr:hypothetical protein [Streptomyces sp. TSRI0281]
MSAVSTAAGPTAEAEAPARSRQIASLPFRRASSGRRYRFPDGDPSLCPWMVTGTSWIKDIPFSVYDVVHGA